MTRYTTPPCPQAETHGPLLPWPSSHAGWYCPHQAHTGNPFYRTDLTPATRSDSPVSGSSFPSVPGPGGEPLTETPESRLGRAPGSGVSLPAAATSPLRGRRALMPVGAADSEPRPTVHGSEPSFGF